MIKTIIIEDEIAGQELLKKNLREYFPECDIIAVADHVDTGIADITLLQPDLVFVDIHIKGGTGFDILDHFKDKQFELIFITAYSSYAIQAIKEGALDYILKPINSNEFKSGVNKALERIRKKTTGADPGVINITTSNGNEFVNFSDIIFLEAEGAHTSIHLSQSKILSTKNIGEYEVLLGNHSFFRTHHSFIVNTNQVEKFNKGRSGVLFMKTGHTIPVSQRKMREFGERIKNKF